MSLLPEWVRERGKYLWHDEPPDHEPGGWVWEDREDGTERAERIRPSVQIFLKRI